MFHGSRQQREQHRADNDMYDGGTVVGAVFRHATVNPPAARARLTPDTKYVAAQRPNGEGDGSVV